MSGYSEEKFISLVKKAEQDAEKNLGLYKTKIALFAVLGYAVIFLVLATLVLLVGGTVGLAIFSTSILLLLVKKKFIFVILIAIWTFLKALWVKFEAPEGFTLDKKSYPKLFDEIEHLTKSLNALKIHQVILTNELNASVVQHPRFGILGGQRNVLIVGLQLLFTLSPEEMRAVLAHEFGHLSGNHSKFSGWIYRVRVSWMRIMHAFENSHSFGAKIMRSFFDWYAPRFSAYSFALARNNEFSADQISSELTSADITAQALVNVHATAPYIDEKYWEKYFQKANEQEKPPMLPYLGLADFLKNKRIDSEELSIRVEKELTVETHYGDTHPALKDRLKALDADKIMPQPMPSNAAESWLDSHYTEVVRMFDKDWMEINEERWKEQYEYASTAKKAIDDYSGKDLNELSDEELWEFASYSLDFESEATSLKYFHEYLKRDPESVGAAYYIGRALVRDQDIAAMDYLRIAANSPNTIGDVANWGYDLLAALEQNEQAEAWWNEVSTLNEDFQKAYEERQQLSLDDDFKKAELKPDDLEHLITQLKQHKNVKTAWIQEKVLTHAKNQTPVYIIAFKPKGFFIDYGELNKKLANEIETDLELFIVCTQGDTKKLAKKIKKQGMQLF